jgi:FAD:protein FMN transferase
MRTPSVRSPRYSLSTFWRTVVLGIAIGFVILGCDKAKTRPLDAASSRTKNNATAAAKDDVPIVARSQHIMGTIFNVTIAGEDEQKVDPVIQSVFSEMNRLERVLSDRVEQSEVSRINAAAGKQAIKVSSDTMEVIKAGLELSQWSQGAFDLSWAALRGLYSFDPDNQRHPTPKELKSKLALINYRDIHIDEKAQTVMLRQKGMQIGVGAIGKGFALDRAGAILERAGIKNYMLFAGGQIQFKGKKGGRHWRVGIRHPRHQDYFAVLEVTEGSVSTSGDYEHSFVENGKRWHHILDPKTGLPVEHTTSVTVLSKKGIYADALSTAIFVLGPERALQLLPSAPGKPEALIVDKDFKLYQSPGITSRLTIEAALDQGRLSL